MRHRFRKFSTLWAGKLFLDQTIVTKLINFFFGLLFVVNSVRTARRGAFPRKNWGGAWTICVSVGPVALSILLLAECTFLGTF